MSKQESFASLYEAHQREFFTRAMRFMRGNRYDANDLLQETMLKAWRFFDSFEEGTNFAAWITKMMRQVWINSYKHRQVVAATEATVILTALNATTQKCDDRIYAMQLLKKLDKKRKRAVGASEYLYYIEVEGYEYAEVAEKFNVPIGTVLQSVWRTKQAIKMVA